MNILKNKVILKELRLISKKINLTNLILFGSRAKGNFKKTSDYDFAYFSKNNLTAEQEINLFNEIMYLLKTENLDLINLSSNTDVKLRFEIFQNGFSIYEIKNYEFSDLKGKAYIDYIDFQRFMKNRQELLSNRIQAI